MTIKIIDFPRQSESHVQILTNVKACTQFRVIFHDGHTFDKRLCSKVELLSVQDAPEYGTPEYKDFEREYGRDWHGFGIYQMSWDEPMKVSEFEALDLLTHL
jgi:hypothetical protein